MCYADGTPSTERHSCFEFKIHPIRKHRQVRLILRCKDISTIVPIWIKKIHPKEKNTSYVAALSLFKMNTQPQTLLKLFLGIPGSLRTISRNFNNLKEF